MPSDETIKWILTKRFRGSETAGTRLFEHFDDPLRRMMLEAVTLAGDEAPVVAWLARLERWVLVTTRRIIGRLPTGIVEIDANALTSAQPDFLIHIMKMAPSARHDEATAWRLKQTAKEVQLTLASGDTYCLEVEPGDSYFGMLNILVHFGDCYHVRRQLAAREAGESG